MGSNLRPGLALQGHRLLPRATGGLDQCAKLPLSWPGDRSLSLAHCCSQPCRRSLSALLLKKSGGKLSSHPLPVPEAQLTSTACTRGSAHTHCLYQY